MLCLKSMKVKAADAHICGIEIASYFCKVSCVASASKENLLVNLTEMRNNCKICYCFQEKDKHVIDFKHVFDGTNLSVI